MSLSLLSILYNRQTGQCEEIGTWNLVGNEYVTDVEHFTEFNADVIFESSACIRIVSNTLPSTYIL